MADTKITGLTENTAVADNDMLPHADVSEPDTRKISIVNLFNSRVHQAAGEYTKNQNLDSVDLTISTGAVALDFETDGNAKLSLTADATISAPSSLVDGRAVMLKVTEDGTGGHSLAFNAAIDFAGNDSAHNDAASAVTWYLLWTDGTNVYARKIWEDD
jgi:hypothetical protein